ncbi:hypothetical protein ACFLQW_02685 [Candidatus Zixiibacteriota bacterium]
MKAYGPYEKPQVVQLGQPDEGDWIVLVNGVFNYNGIQMHNGLFNANAIFNASGIWNANYVTNANHFWSANWDDRGGC